MKKVLSLVAVLLCMGLTACGGATQSSSVPAPAPTPTPTPADSKAPEAPEAPPAEESGEDDSWEKIQQKGEFIMGLSSSYPPSSFIDDSGEIVGFEIDFAGEVCKRLGIKLVKHEIVWEEKEDDLALGKIDCIWSAMSVTPEREKSMYLSEPYMRNNLVMIASPESGIHSLDDIYGKTIGVPDSSTSKDLLEKEYGSDIYLTSIQDNSDVLRQLKLGVVDAVCMDSIVANYWNATNGGGYTVFPVTEDSETYAIAFRKSDVSLRNKVQETIDEVIADGTFAEISMKWFGKDVYAEMVGEDANTGSETPVENSDEASATEEDTVISNEENTPAE